MEENRISRTPPCTVWDMEAMESWLHDMAMDGWLLTNCTALFGRLVFREEAADHVSYRLIPVRERGEDQPNGFFLEDMRKLGWEFVRKWEEFFVFRSFDPTAKEPYSTLERLAADLDLVKKRLRQQIYCGILVILILFGMIWWQGPTLLLISMMTRKLGWLFPALLILICLALLLPPIRAVRGLRDLQSKLRSGQPLNHQKGRHAQPARLWNTFVWSLPLLIMFFSLYSNLGEKSERYPLADFPGDPPFATVEDLAPDETVTCDHFNSGYFRQGRGLFIPRAIQWWDVGYASYADGTPITPGLMDIEYIEAPNHTMAMAFARDLARRSRGGSRPDLPLLNGLDADFADAIFRNGVRIILAQGNHVVSARIDMSDIKGNFTLENWARTTVEKMKNES